MSIDRYLRYHYSLKTSDTFNKSTNEYSYSSDDTSESDRHKDFLKEIAFEALSRTYSYGSCTFLLGVLEGSSLKICSLGDGSILILRFVDDKPVILLKTNSQQHSFNTPFQICNSPPNSSHVYISDSPYEGDSYEVSLREGDIIIAGSDGLWDNLYLQDIIYIVQLHKSDLHKLAKFLADKAYQLSKSCAKTPFEEEVALKYGEGHWKGGKPDDISVVTAIVSK
jgi:protein phosphatase PTC7